MEQVIQVAVLCLLGARGTLLLKKGSPETALLLSLGIGVAALLFLQLHRQASYALYFLAAVSLCTGVYNLMPFGVLDGARLLQNLLPAEKQDALRRAQRLLLCLFCAAALGFALLGGMPRGARAAAFLGPGYLLAKEFRQK